LKSEFAPAQKASQKQLELDIDQTKDLPLIKDITHLIPDPFVILNQQRQIVYCNTILLKTLSIDTPEKIYGKRPGDAFNCIHSDESEGGCGTTAFCRHCGAVNAILKSQSEENQIKQEECRLTTRQEKTSFDFLILAKTLKISDTLFTFVIVKDIGSEKRKQALERIFFHDIINTAGGLQGLIDLIENADDDEKNEFIALAKKSSHSLIEEINAQKDLLAAENNHLEIELSDLNSQDIISSVIAIYKNHPVTRNKTIQMDTNVNSILFSSDPRLLIRVLGNMCKNALEAEPQGKTITIGARQTRNQIEFWVHNPTPIPDAAKRQIFQRSFSTKGSGRGLGTYSMKLLGEKYLKGHILFSSDEISGTRFFIVLPLKK